jgi:hypothetical protein
MGLIVVNERYYVFLDSSGSDHIVTRSTVDAKGFNIERMLSCDDRAYDTYVRRARIGQVFFETLN